MKGVMGLAAVAALVASVARVSAADVKTAAAADLGAANYGVAPDAWTGFYVGGQGGGAWADFGAPGLSSNGGFGGVEAGYNYQLQNRIVLGLEADYNWSALKKNSGMDSNFVTQRYDISSFGSARARIGYATGPLLPYVSGGVYWQTGSIGESCPAGVQAGFCSKTGHYNVLDEQTSVGWTVGGGIEYSLNKHLSTKLEYLHADAGKDEYRFPAGTATARSQDESIDIVRAGFNYRFTTILPPLK